MTICQSSEIFHLKVSLSTGLKILSYLTYDIPSRNRDIKFIWIKFSLFKTILKSVILFSTSNIRYRYPSVYRFRFINIEVKYTRTFIHFQNRFPRKETLVCILLNNVVTCFRITIYTNFLYIGIFYFTNWIRAFLIANNSISFFPEKNLFWENKNTCFLHRLSSINI